MQEHYKNNKKEITKEITKEVRNKLSALRKELEEQLKIIQEYDTELELINVSESYNNNFIEQKFSFFKNTEFAFFRYSIMGHFPRYCKQNELLNDDIKCKITTLLNELFNNENYVVIFANYNLYGTAEIAFIKELFEFIKQDELGKFIIIDKHNRYDQNNRTFVLDEPKHLDNNRVKVCVNAVKHDVAYYEGSCVLNKNIVLIGDEFGVIDKGNLLSVYTKAICDMKPKSVLNLLVDYHYSVKFIHNNVD